MSLILYVRHQIIQRLWQQHVQNDKQAAKIVHALALNHFPVIYDHLAIIDLPGPQTGIPVLNQIFSSLNYTPQGRDYLPEKQNEFMWLAPVEAETQKAVEASPQIVLADFVLEDLPLAIQVIVVKYAAQSPAFPWRIFHSLCGEVYHDDANAAEKLITLITDYCSQKTLALPTLREYLAVKEANELLAWVLVFGRIPNHFGLAVYIDMAKFNSLEKFNIFIQTDLNILLNNKGGSLIKGNAKHNIAQSATEGEPVRVMLSDAAIDIPSPFMEFVWRAGKTASPHDWKDYYQGFIGQQATQIIESVYTQPL